MPGYLRNLATIGKIHLHAFRVPITDIKRNYRGGLKRRNSLRKHSPIVPTADNLASIKKRRGYRLGVLNIYVNFSDLISENGEKSEQQERKMEVVE